MWVLVPAFISIVGTSVTIWVSGPTYTTAPNQNAMVIRLIGMLAISLAIGASLVALCPGVKNRVVPKLAVTACGLLTWIFLIYLTYLMLNQF